MIKVVIIGAKGMAGHVIYNYFKENTDFKLISIARGTEFFMPDYQTDVNDFSRLKEIFKNEQPNVVVNCIGILNKDAEDHPDKAILMNSYFPHFLAQQGTENGFKLIHISTDCVFNGQTGGYKEDSLKDGFGFYAQTKGMGEVNYGQHLTLRTSIIGPELKENGIGLFNWFMHQEGLIKGYTQAFWSGVTTLELAKGIIKAIEQDIKGLHHFTNGDKVSKYELTGLFKQIFVKATIQIKPYDGYQVDKSFIRTNLDFVHQIPSYKTMLEELKAWMDDHRELYQGNYYN
jgi:dTDP-4-dehydrorhamnose reductase